VKRDPEFNRANDTTSTLNATLEKRLLGYAAAACAAGVGLLATAPTARAEIVVTRANLTLTNGTLLVDLNHDGISDFGLKNGTNLGTHRYLVAYGVGASRNGIEPSFAGCSYPPAALRALAPIDGLDLFCHRSEAPLAAVNRDGVVSGPWANTGRAFLGLRFEVSGQTHYGWAALSVKARVLNHSPTISVTLLAYAYNTVPGQPIRAGQTESTTGTSSTVQPSLGALALGSQGLVLWRRDSIAEGSQTCA
jgi:hypothetical protein